MIKQFRMNVTNGSGQRFTYAMGYQFYGMLMEKLEPEYVARLHAEQLTPINQSLVPVKNGEEAVWTVNILGEEAIDKAAPVLDQLESMTMTNNELDIRIVSKECTGLSTVQDIIKSASEAYHSNRTLMSFLTPTSFKSKETYMLFPSVEHIVGSLINKWNMYSGYIKIEDSDAQRFMIDGIKIDSYRLQSSYYHLKGAVIPGFIGHVVLNSKLPAPLQEIWHLLLFFSSYCGVGIKTSLGMGSVRTNDYVKKTVRISSEQEKTEGFAPG